MTRKILRFLSSLELTIACLAFLMALVVFCTLDQVYLGTYQSVQKYFRSFLIYAAVEGHGFKIPIFPGGGFVGGLLLINLIASHVTRFEWSRRKAGIWLTHCGVILLVFGEFVTGIFAVETQMPIAVGATANYAESPEESELAIINSSARDYDEVISIPQSMLAKKKLIEDPRLPFKLRIVAYYPNAALARRPAGLGPSLATAGIGPSIIVQPRPRVSTDNQRDQTTAYVEILNGSRSLGVWLLSVGLGAPQNVVVDGTNYTLALRPKRLYFPYTLTLKKFRHDLYPGTEIPKNFSSLVHLNDAANREERDVLIYMNSPLRYRGTTFYQASFLDNDTVSVLQAVQNPGWRLPYLSCALVALGLLIQFLSHLLRFKAQP